MDLEKVKGIQDQPKPQKIKEVQAFLGLANFYRRFIKDFSKMAGLLYKLTKKELDWRWTSEEQKVFDMLKHAFTTALILVSPDTDKQLRIESDT